MVTATVRPLSSRLLEAPLQLPNPARPKVSPAATLSAAQPIAPKRDRSSLQPIEPGRRRKLERDRGVPDNRVDLHGHNQDGARDVLTRFVLTRHAHGARSVLVITGKGALGEGILRRRVPDWLAQPPLRDIVAGVSDAHRRHGGEGALYVALKRRSPG